MSLASAKCVFRSVELTRLYYFAASLIWPVVLIAILALASGRAAALNVHSDQPLEKVRLQLKWKHQFQSAGYYAALEQGYYRDAGLDVQILEATADVEPAEAVLQGQADFGVATSDLVLLRYRGHPVVALAAIYQHSPLVLLAPREAGIDSVHDLVGKRVMIEAHSAELLAYLEYEGISSKDLILHPHTFDPSALIEGRVDAMSAYATDEPFLLQAQGKDYRLFTPRAAGIDFYGDTLFTTETQIRKDPDKVRAFVEASLRGWKYALEQPEEMITLILTEYSQRHSREHLAFEARMTERLILPDIVEIGYMNPGRWRHIADTYARIGMISAHFPLQGFLYDRNPQPDLRWLYFTLGGGVLVLTVVTSITVRFYQMNRTIRRQFDELVQMEAELRVAEKRYRVLAENAPFPIAIVRLRDHAIRYVNPKAAEVLEESAAHTIGKTPATYYSNPEDRERLLRMLDRRGYVQNQQVRLKRTTGEGFWVSMSMVLTEYEDEPAVVTAFMDISEHKQLERRLHELAITDALTGRYNRRYFMAKLDENYRYAKRYGSCLCLLMLDVDYFKSINDRYGHDGGDRVLQQIAAIIQGELREVDILARLGGEEFGALLPNIALDHGRQVAERIRQAVEVMNLQLRDEAVRVTLSVGIAIAENGIPAPEQLLKQADTALYEAKRHGRNCVVGYDEGTLNPGCRLAG